MLSELYEFGDGCWDEITVLPNFHLSISHSVFEIFTQLFECELNFYRGPTYFCKKKPIEVDLKVNDYRHINIPSKFLELS